MRPAVVFWPSMPKFHYKAVTTEGGRVRGAVDATDRASAAVRVQAQGHILLGLTSAKPAHRLHDILTRELGGGHRFGRSRMAQFIGRLALLLGSGVPLDQALALLAGSEGMPAGRRQAAALLSRLRAGAALADAMAADTGVFPPVVIAMVRAGETGGTLSPTLDRLADHLARTEAVRQAIRSALVYPAVLLVTAGASVLLVLLVVLPQLEPVFADSGAAMPMLTRLAFGASDLIRKDGWLGLSAIVVLGALGMRALADPALRAWGDAVLLRVPLLGVTVRRAEAGRFARVLGTLLAGGVRLPSALALSQPVVGNRAIAGAIERAAVAVRGGGGLSAPLAHSGALPVLAIQMIRIGEATGHLDGMLLRLADLFEADVKRTLDRALALFVPLLTIVLGALVAGIVASVMQAMLSVDDLVH